MIAHHTRAAVALCAALSLTATMARAQTAAQTDPRDAEARAHFERGLSLVQQARWADAVGELEAARAIRAVPAVLFNLGVAHRALGHNLRAIENFRAYLAAVPAGGVSNRESEVQTYINDLTAGVARIRFELQPANVTITLDGEGLAPDTREREVDPGTHVVTLSAPRFRSRQETVQLAPGASTTVRASLVRSDVIVRGPGGGPFVVMGVGGAALIAGVAFTVVRAGAFARYEMLHCDAVTMAGLQHCEPMTLPPDSDYTLGVTMTYAADVSYIAGGIAAAGGLTWLLLSLRNSNNAQEPSTPVSAWVSPTPRGAIVGVGGRM
ncbi:MAG: hypothetical protein U0269_24555 [Polyangiales bacterium]